MTTYVAGDSLVHRADARLKIVALFLFSIGLFFVQWWPVMLAATALVISLVAVARIPLRPLLASLLPVVVLAAFAVLFGTGMPPTLDGFLSGLFVALRMVVLVAASFVVCFTTTSTALLQAFARIIGPLRAVRVPVDDIALTLSLALRFIPVIAEEFVQVRAAQIARGADAVGVPFRRKLEVWGAAFSAVFVGLFRRADALATALDARCYGYVRNKRR